MKNLLAVFVQGLVTITVLLTASVAHAKVQSQVVTYKQGKVAKEHNPKVAADMMGNSVSTAIRRYNKITEAFPIGLVVTLISAAVLRRRSPL